MPRLSVNPLETNKFLANPQSSGLLPPPTIFERPKLSEGNEDHQQSHRNMMRRSATIAPSAFGSPARNGLMGPTGSSALNA